MSSDPKASREERRAAAAERARSRDRSLPEWPAGKPRPTFASEAEELKFLNSYSFADYWARRGAKKQTKQAVVRVRLSEEEKAAVAAVARERGLSLSDVLRESIVDMTHRARESWKIEPGAAAPVAAGDSVLATFAHLAVANVGPAAGRVRCWVRFFRKARPAASIFPDELPGRWASAPQPFSPSAEQKQLAFDPYLASQGHIADFAPREEHALAIAVKLAAGDCFGWTPESYSLDAMWKWKLPSEPLIVRARLLANGREYFRELLLDASASLQQFTVVDDSSAPTGGNESRNEVDAFARAVPLRLISGGRR